MARIVRGSGGSRQRRLHVDEAAPQLGVAVHEHVRLVAVGLRADVGKHEGLHMVGDRGSLPGNVLERVQEHGRRAAVTCARVVVHVGATVGTVTFTAIAITLAQAAASTHRQLHGAGSTETGRAETRNGNATLIPHQRVQRCERLWKAQLRVATIYDQANGPCERLG